MQFSGSGKQTAGLENGNSQVEEEAEDVALAVFDEEATSPAAAKEKAKSVDHQELFTVDLLGSWFKP
jgi:hypothetical protein